MLSNNCDFNKKKTRSIMMCGNDGYQNKGMEISSESYWFLFQRFDIKQLLHFGYFWLCTIIYFFCWRHFNTFYLKTKCHILFQIPLKYVLRSNWHQADIGSSSGLVSNRQRAITWTKCLLTSKSIITYPQGLCPPSTFFENTGSNLLRWNSFVYGLHSQLR